MKGRLQVETVPGEGHGPDGQRHASDSGACALLVVTNHTGRSLWSFNVRSHAGGSWGDELLEGAILPGASAAWQVEPGIYHLRAETADGTRIQHAGLAVACGQLARWVVEDDG